LAVGELLETEVGDRGYSGMYEFYFLYVFIREKWSAEVMRKNVKFF